MRKYRSWLMGLGIGIILGASMLQLIQFANDQAAIAANEPLTREQLNTEAMNAGFTLLPVGQTMYTQVQLDKKVSEAVAAASKPSVLANSAKTGAGDSEDPKAVTLYIRKNMTLTEAAVKLQKLGVIDNADDFIKKADSISKRLNIGTAVFTGKPTDEQIMAELLREK
jgi:hypothetical protein